MNTNEQAKINVKVDPETFLEVTMAQFDDKIAQAEVVAKQAALQIAELKKQRTKAILEYHYNILKSKKNTEITDEQAITAISNVKNTENSKEKMIDNILFKEGVE